MPRRAAEPITAIFTWKVVPGKEAAFEQWAHGIATASTKYPGHQGASWLRKDRETHEYHSIIKFDTMEHYNAWVQSAEREEWLKQAEDFAQGHAFQMTGLETWFTVPGQAVLTPPPRWKMWIVTACVVYLLSIIIQWLGAPFLSSLPFWLRTLVLVLILVTLLTYLAMPAVTFLLRHWLYPRQHGRRSLLKKGPLSSRSTSGIGDGA